MGYYIPSTPQSFALKVIMDVDWDKHLSPRTIMLARGAGIFLDYQLLGGLARLSGFKFPFASPRAAFSSGYSWSRVSPYLIPVLVGSWMASKGITPEKLVGIDPSGRPSMVQGAMDRYYSKLR